MDKSNKYIIMRFLCLVIFISFSNISFASFPVNEMDVVVNDSVEVPTYNNPWYISVKNAILFLAASAFGIGLLSVFITEGFIAPDREASALLLLLPLSLSIGSFFASVFYGKKIYGNRLSRGDRLSKKTVIWSLCIFTFFMLLGGLIGSGGFSGG
jgi:hypothetical protein